MATCKQRNGRFQFRISRKILGSPIYYTFDSKEEGEVYCAHLEKLLDAGIVPDGVKQQIVSRKQVPLKRRSVTLSRLIREYLTEGNPTQADRSQLDIISNMIGKIPAQDFNFPRAEEWVSSLKRERNLAPGTVSKYVGALARCLDRAVRHEQMDVNPLRYLPKGYAQYTNEDAKHSQMKINRIIDRRLNPGEEKRIRQVLAGKRKPKGKQRLLTLEHRAALQTMFDVALETAMRLSEIYALRAEHIDFAQQTIFLHNTKNVKRGTGPRGREVPMTTVVQCVLHDYLKMLGFPKQGLIFPWWGGDVASRHQVTSKLSRLWGRVFEHAECDGLTFHCLRHEGTSRFYERTDLRHQEIMEITGHESEEAHKRYRNLRGSYLAGKLW